MYAAGGAGRRSRLHWEREHSSCFWESLDVSRRCFISHTSFMITASLSLSSPGGSPALGSVPGCAPGVTVCYRRSAVSQYTIKKVGALIFDKYRAALRSPAHSPRSSGGRALSSAPRAEEHTTAGPGVSWSMTAVRALLLMCWHRNPSRAERRLFDLALPARRPPSMRAPPPPPTAHTPLSLAVSLDASTPREEFPHWLPPEGRSPCSATPSPTEHPYGPGSGATCITAVGQPTAIRVGRRHERRLERPREPQPTRPVSGRPLSRVLAVQPHSSLKRVRHYEHPAPRRGHAAAAVRSSEDADPASGYHPPRSPRHAAGHSQS
jgi:hypothetical protein